MEPSKEIQYKISGIVSRCCFLASKHFQIRITVPSICYFPKGRAAGKAWDTGIALNLHLLQTNENEMLEETLPHEIAHCIQRQIYGNDVKPHGIEWQYIMRVIFNKTPNRLHKMKTIPAKKFKRVAYNCNCRVHLVTLVRHRRIIENRVTYKCKHCNSPITMDMQNEK